MRGSFPEDEYFDRWHQLEFLAEYLHERRNALADIDFIDFRLQPGDSVQSIREKLLRGCSTKMCYRKKEERVQFCYVRGVAPSPRIPEGRKMFTTRSERLLRPPQVRYEESVLRSWGDV